MILGSVILQVQEDARAGVNSKAFHQRKNNLDVFLGWRVYTSSRKKHMELEHGPFQNLIPYFPKKKQEAMVFSFHVQFFFWVGG